MTHTASHIVISKLGQTVSFGEPDPNDPMPPPSNLRLWHLIVALLFAGIAIGLSVASAI